MTVQEYNTAVDQYADNLFRFALKHVRNEMAAQDIVQETFEKVWAKHESIDGAKVRSYLFTTAYHAIVDWAKGEKRNGDFEQISEPGSSGSFEYFDIQKVLHDALNTLPEVQKSVVLLRDYEGYNYAEIAEITGLNESQVKVYIFRARKALQGYLQDVGMVI